jgi:GNAT superfamily N-acetyltransferase
MSPDLYLMDISMTIKIKLLEAGEIPVIATTFVDSPWKTPAAYIEELFGEQEKGRRSVLVAYSGTEFAGYVTIKWQSDYPYFAEKGIPEIADLRVLPAFRRRGIATALMNEAEKRIFARSPVIGIGVGVYADYGPAQRMYVMRGYVPDGLGLFHKNVPVVPGRHILVDDNLVLYFIKERDC